MKRTFFTCLTLLTFITVAQSQDNRAAADSLHIQYLPELTVVGLGSKTDIQQIPEIVGTTIYAGKKNALIKLDNVQGNVVTNTMRQVMAKVPGIHIWESDGSGIQIGIAARGLSPNRSWEFNVRQNGYDISADPFGYPEAYYNPQLQSVQQIEIVRGQGALQYGPQFGGMVNYILKDGSKIGKPFTLQSEQTVGSNGLFNSFNAIGGKLKKWHYYTFYDHRHANGWRDNSYYSTGSAFGTVTYKPNSRFSIGAEVMRWNMLSQQPGGLTDSLFETDARTSFRSRNWFDLAWLTGAITGNYAFSAKTKLNFKVFGIHGNRNSIGYNPSGGIQVADTINTTTLDYNHRTLDVDRYRNYGAEGRFMTEYHLGKMRNTLSAGARIYQGNTFRLRGGKGSTGVDFDSTEPVDDSWNGDIEYRSRNMALFAEHIFRIRGDKWYIIPGARIEFLGGAASGFNGIADGTPIVLQPQTRNRWFLLSGIGTEYHLTPSTELYANISQAYRPIQFADLTTPPTTDEINPQLKDATGANTDIGYRGKLKDYLFFDMSAFYMNYNNRIGTLRQQRADGSFYNYRTNVGKSTSLGIEAVAEFSPVRLLVSKVTRWNVSMFASYSYTNARYGDFKVIKQTGTSLEEINYRNNRVENAPEHILRAGISTSFRGAVLTLQHSYTDEMFSDANNTETPTSNGQNGLIPAYSIWDLTFSYKFEQQYYLKAGVNNLTDARYFTRRAGGYPGPGLLPADGRSFFLSVGAWF